MRNGFRLPALWRKDRTPMAPLYSEPLPQRLLTGQDTNHYVQPTQVTFQTYLTFWNGNQLPNSHIIDAPHMRYVKVSSQDNRVVQFNGGSFNVQMGTVQTARLVARMRAAWRARAGN